MIKLSVLEVNYDDKEDVQSREETYDGSLEGYLNSQMSEVDANPDLFLMNGKVLSEDTVMVMYHTNRMNKSIIEYSTVIRG